MENELTHPEVLRDASKAAKGAGIFLLGNLVGAPLTLLTQIIIARLLGVEGFGLYELGLGIMRLLEIIGRLGLNVAGMRFVSVARIESSGVLKGVILSSLGLSTAVSAVLALLLMGTAPMVAETFFRNSALTAPLRWFALGLVLITLVHVSSSLLLGFQRTQYKVWVTELAQPSSQLLLVVLFWSFGSGLTGVIWALIASHLIALIMAVFFLLKLSPELANSRVAPVWRTKEILAAALPLVFVAILNYLTAWADTLLLGMLGTAAAVGVYRAAWRVSSAMNLLLNATNSIYGPMVAELHSLSEKDRIAHLYKTTTRWVSYASVPIFLLLTVVPGEIMGLFGRGFEESSAWLLRVLALGSLINCLTGGSGITLIMLGKQDALAKISTIGGLLNVGANLVLIPLWGAMGAALSSSVSVAVSNAVKVFAVLKWYRMHPFDRRVMKFLLHSFLAGLMLMFLKSLLIPGIWSVALIGLLVFVVCGLLVIKDGRDIVDGKVLIGIVKVLRKRGSTK